ncbi:MAG: 4-hydroxy-tetrahydrodipicolinate synthase [Verrucomicrobiaceae bacterium]|nr:MAG: 4-hydroxy-tetrahydrodipicolinate synthase [Verrucomicrobiaceae bacterium]
MFAGTFTALVTPFQNDHLDEAAFERLVEDQIEAGVTGIVPVGTTGESPTLDHAEHARVIELAVKASRKRCKVIAGTGSNSTTEAVSLTVEAEKLGADAALLVAPYYNKPSQEGLYRHYRKIAEATKLPLILYSIPGRCGVEIAIETVVRLAKDCPNIVAIKEAGGTVERVSALRAVLPEEFQILSGDDSLTLPFIAAGAVGVISVASNLVPGGVCDLVQHALAGRFEEARRVHLRLYPLFKDLFVETNPVPIKAAMALAGKIQPHVRLPLCELSSSSQQKLEATLRELQLLS